MKQATILFLCCTAQQVSNKSPTHLTQYFIGKWEGKGSFANGKPIAACRYFGLKPILAGSYLLLITYTGM
jgi:hypothetical protein